MKSLLEADRRCPSHYSFSDRSDQALSLPSLDVKIIERFALLEFRLGEAERGKTIYEGLVDKYPKKLNLWNAYIDQIGKQGDIQGVRYVFLCSATCCEPQS